MVSVCVMKEAFPFNNNLDAEGVTLAAINLVTHVLLVLWLVLIVLMQTTAYNV